MSDQKYKIVSFDEDDSIPLWRREVMSIVREGTYGRPKCLSDKLRSMKIIERVLSIRPDSLDGGLRMNQQLAGRAGEHELCTGDVHILSGMMMKGERLTELNSMFFRILSMSPSIKAEFFKYCQISDSVAGGWLRLLKKKQLDMVEKRCLRSFVQWIIICASLRRESGKFWSVKGELDPSLEILISSLMDDALAFYHKKIEEFDVRLITDSMLMLRPAIEYKRPLITFEYALYEDCKELAESNPEWKYLSESGDKDSEPIIIEANVIEDYFGIFSRLLKPGFNLVNLEKMRHEAVCERMFESSSDEKFRDYFVTVPGCRMNLTPDNISKISENKWIIYEVATSREDSRPSLMGTLIKKYHKYQETIFEIKRHYKEELNREIDIELRIIVVSFNSVLINFSPESMDLEEKLHSLCSVYQIADEVSKDIIKRLPIRDPINLNDDKFRSKVQTFIKSIEDYKQREDLEIRMKNPNLYISPERLNESHRIEMSDIVSQRPKNADFLKEHFENLDPENTYKAKNAERKTEISGKRVLRIPDFYGSDEFELDELSYCKGDCLDSKDLIQLIKSLVDPDIKLNDIEADIEIEAEDRKFLKSIVPDTQEDGVFEYVQSLENSKASEIDKSTKMGSQKKRGAMFKSEFNLSKEVKERLHLVKQVEKTSGLILDWENDIEFIDDFLKRKDLMEEEEVEHNMVFERFSRSLENESLIDEEQQEHLTQMGNKRIFSHLKFWSLVFQTVSKSLMVFTSKNEVLVKNVEGTNAKVIIKNTSVKGPVWISVISKNGKTLSGGDIFGKSFEISASDGEEFFYVSKFVSYQFSDLEMFINAYEILLGIHEVIGEIFEENQTETFLLCFLIFLEAKSKTCADIQNLRYFYMELIKTNEAELQAPFKIMDKFDNNVRSKLHLWLWKRMKSLYDMRKTKSLSTNPEEKSILEEEMIQEEEETSDLFLYKPINFINGSPCSSVRECLFLSYLGVLKNKKDVDKFSNSKKMLKKIIAQELKLTDISKWSYNKDKTEDINAERKTHQFTPAFVKPAAENLWKKIQEKSGCDSKDHFFRTKIIPELMKRTLDDVATFKSSTVRESAVFDDIRDDIKEEKRKKRMKEEQEEESAGKDKKSFKTKTVIRSKLITVVTEGIQKKVLTNPHVMMDVPEYASELDNFLVSLFKKDQWGGLREIYVLDFKSRILALFVETISRTLASYLDNEILTKGSDKSKESRDHKLRIKLFKKLLIKSAGDEGVKVKKDDIKITTFHDAADRTTWCQQFINPIFATVLKELVPEWVLPLICDILNLHTLKLIQIPEELCKAFVLNPQIVDMDDDISELKDEYLGRKSSNLVLRPGATWIRNESNMMQGILHFTSSLLHSSIMYLMEERVKKLSEELQEIGPISLHFSSRVSSDDASFSVTFIRSSKSTIDVMECYKELCSWHLLSLKHFCVRDSIKSTHFITKEVQEFNSEFEVGNSKVFPTVPHLVAALQLPSEVDPYKRILELFNTRTALMEKGISGRTLMKICFLQKRVHYKCLMGASESYNHLCSLLLQRMPIDFFGYFYMDCPYIGPALGQSFNRFYHMNSNAQCRRSFEKFVMMTGVDNLVENSLDYQFRWKITPDLKKMNAMIRQMTSEDNVNELGQFLILGMKREKVGEELILKHSAVDFTCKFRGSKNLEESICKIVEKTYDSNLARSLSFVDKISTIRISAFFLSSICVKVKKNFKVDKNLNELLSKFSEREHSFLSVLATLNLINSDLEEEDFQDEEYDWRKYFPLNLDYSQVLDLCRKRHDSTNFIKRKGKPVMKKLPLKIYKGDLPGLVSNLDVIKMMWYNISKPNTNKKLILEKWKILKIKLDWLRNSPEETLSEIECPFDSETAIISFFEKWTVIGSRSLSLMGPFVMRVNLDQKIQSIIERFFDHSRIFFIGEDDEKFKDSPIEAWKNLRFFPSIYKRFLLEKKGEPDLQDTTSLKFLDNDKSRFSRFEDITAWPENFVEDECGQYLNEIFRGNNESGLTYYYKTNKDFSQVVLICRGRMIEKIKAYRATSDQVEKTVSDCVTSYRLEFPRQSYSGAPAVYISFPLLKVETIFDRLEYTGCLITFCKEQVIKDALYTNSISTHIENSWMVITLTKTLSIKTAEERREKKISDQPLVFTFEDQALKLNINIKPEGYYRPESSFLTDPGALILKRESFDDLFWYLLNMSSLKDRSPTEKAIVCVKSIFGDSISNEEAREMLTKMLKDLDEFFKSQYQRLRVKEETDVRALKVEGEVELEGAQCIINRKDIQEWCDIFKELEVPEDDSEDDKEDEEKFSFGTILRDLREISLQDKSSNVREWSKYSNCWLGCKMLAMNMPSSRDAISNYVYRLCDLRCPERDRWILFKRLRAWCPGLESEVSERFEKARDTREDLIDFD